MAKKKIEQITMGSWPECSTSYNRDLEIMYDKLDKSGLLDEDFDDILNTLFDLTEINEYLKLLNYFTNPKRFNKFNPEEKEILSNRKAALEVLFTELDFSWSIYSIIS